MKLHRLELQGFGPFLDRQSVDFDAFDDEGIFLISGRTGAGKSSILDGVSFALYGSVPRYDSGEKRIRSDHSAPDDPSEVVLEFTTDDRRFTITRSPDYEKPKKRGEGLTPVAHAARLDELIDGVWVTLAAKPREVAHLLADILGLTQQQFLQVILLAQNRFAQFLLAKNDERQALLRTLFGSRIYGDYQAALERRRKDAEQALARGGDGVALLLGEADLLISEHRLGPEPAHDEADSADAERSEALDAAARIVLLERAVERARYRVDTLDRERSLADEGYAAAAAAHMALLALRQKHDDRAASRKVLIELDGAEPAIAAQREQLERAGQAENLRAPIEAAARAEAAAHRAGGALRLAAEAWQALGEEDEPDAAVLRERIDSMTGELSVWAEAVSAERESAVLRTQLDAERARESALTETLADLARQQDALPAQLAALDVEITLLNDAPVALEIARAAAASIADRLAAALDAEAKAEKARSADAAHLERSEALEHAAALVTVLFRRRFAGYAGELADRLVDGEACAVCGSTEHPAPAEHSDEPVTEEAIAAAERDRDAAAEAASVAAALARTARTAHAEAAGRAGGESAQSLESSATEALLVLSDAETAATRRSAALAERDEITAAATSLARDQVELTSRIAIVRQECAVLDERAARNNDTVARARGDAVSVAARVEQTTHLRHVARTLAEAIDENSARLVALREANHDRDERVAASGFGDHVEAAAALVDETTRAATAERVREHEIVVRTARERLRELELELAGTPDEPILVEESEAAVVSARESVREATEAATRAVEAAERLRSLVSRATAAHAASAELAAEYESIAALASAISGRTPSRMDLETFVLAAELEEIVAAANLRLSEMSSGRYLLQHTDAVAARNAASGLGIEIIDAFTGRTRPAQSLSGGESFLASLALALGLAEVVTARAGGVTLDTLFIDEGFGSLDDDTLELAMRTLDELRQGGRTVGLISHVAAMKDQLPAQLIVEATPQGPSVIRQGAAIGTGR